MNITCITFICWQLFRIPVEFSHFLVTYICTPWLTLEHEYFLYLAGSYSSKNGTVKGEITGRSWRTLQRGKFVQCTVLTYTLCKPLENYIVWCSWCFWTDSKHMERMCPIIELPFIMNLFHQPRTFTSQSPFHFMNCTQTCPSSSNLVECMCHTDWCELHVLCIVHV